MGLAKIWKVEVPSRGGEYWVVLPKFQGNVAEACFESLEGVVPGRVGDRERFLGEARVVWERNCWAGGARVMKRDEVARMGMLPAVDKVQLPPFGSLLK